MGLLIFILQPFIQRHAYKASFLAFAISAHSVFGHLKVNETIQVKGLSTCPITLSDSVLIFW